MDRFIDVTKSKMFKLCNNLKSSMDRFIVYQKIYKEQLCFYLKSSMDRFIADEEKAVAFAMMKFKIQYG